MSGKTGLNLQIYGSKIHAVQVGPAASHREQSAVSRGQPDDRPPEGPGWERLSDTLYFNNEQPLKEGERVYKGKHKLVQKWVDAAVKLVPFRQKNWTECEVITKLEIHPYIVRIYEAGTLEGSMPQIYIATALCSQTLKDYIEQNKQNGVNFNKIYDFTKQIFEAVEFIHLNNIIHGDIQTDNILISRSSFVQIADFGFSRESDGNNVQAEAGAGVGAEGFIAPEVCTGKSNPSYKSDVFALGIVTHMLFTKGKHPYGQEKFRWQANIVDNCRDLSHIPTFAKHDQLVDLLSLCLKPDPSDRLPVKSLLEHEFFTGKM